MTLYWEKGTPAAPPPTNTSELERDGILVNHTDGSDRTGTERVGVSVDVGVTVFFVVRGVIVVVVETAERSVVGCAVVTAVVRVVRIEVGVVVMDVGEEVGKVVVWLPTIVTVPAGSGVAPPDGTDIGLSVTPIGTGLREDSSKGAESCSIYRVSIPVGDLLVPVVSV